MVEIINKSNEREPPKKSLEKIAEERYSRQQILSEIGKKGQEKIRNSCIAIVGIGALGTAAAELLARAGVGKLILIDRDVVELSNLQRQLLFTEKYFGRSKAAVAAERLKEINSEIEIISHAAHLSLENSSLITSANLVLDCTDNLQTRFVINQTCRKNNIPWIYAAAIRTEGYVLPIFPQGPCLRCFLSASPMETCATAGVLNTIALVTAAYQVTLALKIILQGSDNSARTILSQNEAVRKVPEGELLKINVWQQTFRKIKIKKRKDCPVCLGKEDPLINKNNIKPISFCSAGRYQIMGKEKDWKKLQKLWEKKGVVFKDEETLTFQGIVLFKDGRALVKANSEAEAQAIYDKWVGN